MDQFIAQKIWRVMEPIVIHFFIMNMVKMIGLHVDAAFLTTLAAILTLPILFFLYMRDGRKSARIKIKDVFFIILLACLCNLFFTILMNQIQSIFDLSNETQEQLFASQFVIQLLGVGIIVPIMEEVLFRGLVYRRLKDYNDTWTTLLLAAAMFAVYHGNMIQILFAFPLGGVLIWVYRHWDSLLASVIFHMTINISSVIVMAYFW